MSVYLIYSNTNQYDSYNVVIGYSLTEGEAIKAVESLKESYVKARDFYDNFISPAEAKFRKENPSPSYSPMLTIPRWPKGMKESDITQEMRDERQAISAKNNEMTKAYSASFREWQIKQNEYIKLIFEPVMNESWFQKWFEVGERFFICNANGLVKGHEYIYEICEELK